MIGRRSRRPYAGCNGELADHGEIDGHAKARRSQYQREDDSIGGGFAGYPGSGAELPYSFKILNGGADVDEDAEAYKDHSRPHGDACTLRAEVGLACAQLPQEKSEAAYGKTYTHEREASANPGEKGPLGREVYPRILLYGLVHEEL